MYYNNSNIADIDLSKYDRLVTLGCSFTRYRWATWADLLAQDMPNAEYTNLGKCGAGNSYIQTMLSQAKRKMSLANKDLVVICWSTFYREDKWIDGQWRTPGNVFGRSDVFSDEYFKQHVDVQGMTMRDCAIIDTVTQSLKQEEFDSFALNREKVIFPNRPTIIYLPKLASGEYGFIGEYHPDTARGSLVVLPLREYTAQQQSNSLHTQPDKGGEDVNK